MKFRFPQYSLIDILAERIGYKAGLLLSLPEILKLLTPLNFKEIILSSEKNSIILRAEDFEHIYFTLLKCIGYLQIDYEPDPLGVSIYHKYKDTKLDIVKGVLSILVKFTNDCVEDAKQRGSDKYDPTPLFIESFKQFGKDGIEILHEFLQHQHAFQMLSLDTNFRYDDWNSIISLEDLFLSQKNNAETRKYLDQRYINYLSQNYSEIESINWRKFEELTAEYFSNHGFKIELGPGAKDDGVDIRAWNSDNLNELTIIQCKRQKSKIDKVIVKGLQSDVIYNNAKYGLIVTTSELSKGARETISTRGYPIEEINKPHLMNWLNQLKTPGRGIIRK
ncbi:restriction endonuclease [Legionella longbeachae]|uniref:restriction endonuclease n=1 Tax=Legionella longbeachae TaxID=450 RepID=UPI001C18BA4D|nr:restriction endonuclease [Legionella pneumophila]